MLTVDLVHARRRGATLSLAALKERTESAREIAHELLALAENMIGESRQQVESAFAALPVPASDEKLRDGIAKLLQDAFEFESSTFDAAELRKRLFCAAVAHRDAHNGKLHREEVLSSIANELGLEADPTPLLYADLKQEQRLLSLGEYQNEEAVPHLLASYDTRQIQAVLLRATTLTISFANASPVVVRRVLRSIKFRRLLATATLHETSRRLEVKLEGPYQLFGPTSKYGIDFANLVPTLARISSFEVNAELLWGTSDAPCSMHATVPLWHGITDGTDEAPLHADAQQLFQRLSDRGHQVSIADTPLTLPRMGLWMPDLMVTHNGVQVRIEVLGHYARQGLFDRIEAAKETRDLMIFCASEKLRVREEIAESLSAVELVVYKTAIPVEELLSRIERIAGTTPAKPKSAKIKSS